MTSVCFKVLSRKKWIYYLFMTSWKCEEAWTVAEDMFLFPSSIWLKIEGRGSDDYSVVLNNSTTPPPAFLALSHKQQPWDKPEVAAISPPPSPCQNNSMLKGSPNSYNLSHHFVTILVLKIFTFKICGKIP